MKIAYIKVEHVEYGLDDISKLIIFQSNHNPHLKISVKETNYYGSNTCHVTNYILIII